MGTTIFKSDAARVRLAGWYDKFLGRVTVPVVHREVPTALGPSHVLVAGDDSLPTLVCLHGSLASSAHLLSELQLLASRFRLVLPDLPGQSARGPQIRLPLNDDSLARWLLEVCTGLRVTQFDLLGVSWGGFVARKAATANPDRVRRLVLLVPAGIVGGSVWAGLTRMAYPMTMYRLRPSEERLRRFVEQLFTNWDDDWAHFMGDAIRDFKLDLRIPPTATDAELRGLTMPTLVVAAGDDISFPGQKLLKRVETLVPNVQTELLASSKHSPPTTDEFRKWLADRVTTFLQPTSLMEPANGPRRVADPDHRNLRINDG